MSKDGLHAERELGRFVERLTGSDLGSLWLADAVRREVVGSFAIDGVAVEMEDLAVAMIDPNLLPVLQRDSLDDPARMVALLQDIVAGRRGCVDPPPLPLRNRSDSVSRVDFAGVAAAARAATSSVEAFLAGLGGQVAAETKALPVTPPRPPALSPDWFRSVWFGLTGADMPATLLQAVCSAADQVASRPGLPGAVAAAARIHALSAVAHQRGDVGAVERSGHSDRRSWRFARVLMPFLIQSSCGLDSMVPWLSWSLRRDSQMYARLVERDPEEWGKWVLAGLTDLFRFEREQISKIEAVLASWEHRFSLGGKRRWNSNVRMLQALFQHGVITTKSLHRIRGGDLRSTQLLIKDFRECGIVHAVHHAKGREWFVGVDVFER